ncbi:MAG: NAD(P)H-dependent oxidoreductase [bacterium]
MTPPKPLRALALVCTLSPSPAESSSDLMARQLLTSFAEMGVDGSSVRLVDHDVKPGVDQDMGDGDAWPGIRNQLVAAEIVIVSTPIRLGQLSSVGQRLLERLVAEVGESDADGRPAMSGKVVVTGVVGPEDGAHHATAELFQALNAIGFTIPAHGGVHWNDEAMLDDPRNYKDLDQMPDKLSTSMARVADNATHLARLLRMAQYPVRESGQPAAGVR